MNIHDIAHCKQQAIETAERICAEKGLRLTHTRKSVLKLIWESHQPLKAYAILEKLQEHDPYAKAPIVYRALAFLEEHRFVHKLHTLNMYVGCHTPSSHSDCFFFICSQCHTITEEQNKVYQALIEQTSAKSDFAVIHSSLEVSGVCKDCKQISK